MGVKSLIDSIIQFKHHLKKGYNANGMKTKICILLLFVFSLSLAAQTDSRSLVQRINVEAEAVDAILPQINILIKKGEKSQAKALVEKALKQINQIEADQKQLALLDASAVEEVPSMDEIQTTKRLLTNKYNQLRYTRVHIKCDAELFDEEYDDLQDLIQSGLAGSDVSFVDDEDESDWTITIKAKAREYNKASYGNAVTYFAYVDVKTSIIKTSTEQPVFDKTLSEKGGSPRGFEQAAQGAYRRIAPKVSALIQEQLQ